MQVALLGAEAADPEPAKTPAATKAMPHTENRLCRMTPPLRLVLDHRSLRLVPSSPPKQPSDAGEADECNDTADTCRAGFALGWTQAGRPAEYTSVGSPSMSASLSRLIPIFMATLMEASLAESIRQIKRDRRSSPYP
jgi:hypothetical protein